jgi:hypothetical protein
MLDLIIVTLCRQDFAKVCPREKNIRQKKKAVSVQGETMSVHGSMMQDFASKAGVLDGIACKSCKRLGF